MANRVFQGRNMPKYESEYLKNLREILKRSGKIFGRREPNHPKHAPAEQFDALVRKNDSIAAFKEETFSAVRILLGNGQPIAKILNSVDYLTNKHKITSSRNPALGPALIAIMKKDNTKGHIHANRAGGIFYKLASASDRSVEALAQNPKAGDVIIKLLESHPKLALRTFMVIASHEPQLFAENKSSKRAIKAIEKHHRSRAFDAGQYEVFKGHVATMTKPHEQTLGTRGHSPRGH